MINVNCGDGVVLRSNSVHHPSTSGSRMEVSHKDPHLGVHKRRWVNLTCVFYASFISVLGIALPVASSINTVQAPLRTLYSQVYILYIVVVSLVSLIILLIIIHRQPRRHLILSNHCEHDSEYEVTIGNMPISISYYMRLGLVILSLGILIHYNLILIEPMEATMNNMTYEVNWIMLNCYVLKFIFFILQTYFIFKFYRISINIYVPLVKLCYSHLIATNIAYWSFIVVDDSLHLYNKRLKTPSKEQLFQIITPLLVGNETVSNIKTPASYKARDYLTNFNIQYTILAACVLCQLFFNSGKSLSSRSFVKSLSKIGANDATTVGVQKKFPKCHKANAGLLLGLLLSALGMVYVIAVSLDKASLKHAEVRLIFASIWLGFGLLGTPLVVVVAVRLLSKLEYLRTLTDRITRFNEIILVFTLNCSMLYEGFSIITCITSLNNKTSAADFVKLFINFAFLLQAILQTGFIYQAANRSTMSTKHLTEKPGRNLLTLLIFFNLVVWMTISVRGKLDDMDVLFTTYYGFMAWGMMVSFFVPLTLLYRFMSCVTLTKLWRNAYQIKYNQ